MADGVRPDVLQNALNQDKLPAIAALMKNGALHTLTTCFPSVTGPAYLPFLMGKHPAILGMPGLRWFDRSRSARLSIGNARSYSGIDIWRTHDDVPVSAPTVFELATPSLASMSMFARGASLGNIGRSLTWMLRSIRPHFAGIPEQWRVLEQKATARFFRSFRNSRPRFSMLTINTPDKYAHRWGALSEQYEDSLQDVNKAVKHASDIAEADGWRDQLAIWIVSDHGHSPVAQHDDLHSYIDDLGYKVLAHPKLRVRKPDVALMVGGNSMAHIYVEPEHRSRSWWGRNSGKWQRLHDGIAQRESADLVAVALSAGHVSVSNRNGTAEIIVSDSDDDTRFSYMVVDGDPLELGGSARNLNVNDAWEITRNTNRPDAILQLATLLPAKRSGDIIISAARGWDLRERFEAVPHVSTHGALLSEQMLVPLVLDRPASRMPRRTVEVMPSALQLLGAKNIDYRDSFL